MITRQYVCRGPLTACRTRWRSTRAVSSSQASHQTPPVHFSDLPLDRAGHLRSQPERLDELLRSPSTQLLPFHRGKALVGPASLLSAEAPAQQVYLQLGKGSSSTGSSNGSESGNGVAAGTVTLQLAPCSFATPGAQATAEGQPPKWVPLVLQPGNAMAPAVAALEHGIVDSTGYLFLGLSREGHAVFAFELAAAPVVSGSGGAPVAAAVPAEGQGEAGAAASCQWADVRAAGQGMAGEDAAVLALATGLARWHSSAAFCSRTGAPLVGAGITLSHFPPLKQCPPLLVRALFPLGCPSLRLCQATFSCMLCNHRLAAPPCPPAGQPSSLHQVCSPPISKEIERKKRRERR